MTQAPASLTVHQWPSSRTPSPDYRVRVDGRDVFVHHCDSASYAIVCATGRHSVSVESSVTVQSAVVRPLRFGIAPAVQATHVEFELETPATVSIEINGNLRAPLFLFCMPPETDVPRADDPQVVYFAGGREYDARQIELKSGQTLYIEGGAVVHGLVSAECADSIAIRGRGILDGGKYRNEWKPEGRKPALVRPAGCTGVVVEGVTLVDGPSWTLVPCGCRDVAVRDVNIITCTSTGDGVDVVGSSDVCVERCFIRADDDCVALKSVDYFSERGIGNVERVRVEGCTLWNGKPGDALEIGYETRCEFVRDVVFKDCDIIHTEFEGWQSGAAISIHNADRAEVSNIRYQSIRIEDCQEKLFDLKVLQTYYSRDGVRGAIRDIEFRDISVTAGPFPVSIMRGYAERGNNRGVINDIRFVNVRVHGEHITSANQARMVVELASSVVFE